jgi:hypothetical protein
MIRYHSTCSILCQFVMCLLIFLPSCKDHVDKTADLSSYYLPMEALEGEGLLYSYRSIVDTTLVPEVWQHIKTSEGHITSINYDPSQQVVLKQYERVVGNGVLIDSLNLFFYDSMGRTLSLPVRVLSPHRFPFQPRDSTQVWLSHFEWWQPHDSLHVVLQRRRRFMGETTWNWEGKPVPAVRFRTEDSFETEKDGWTTSSWTGEEVYAKNIGLIYYRRNISKELELEFELESRRSIKTK